jgi:hypothetical protein
VSFIGNAVGKIVGGITGANQQAKAAGAAAATQAASAQAGIDEQRRQFDELQALLRPYVDAGTGSLSAQQNLIGLGGAGSQRNAINAIQNGAEFQALNRQGQSAILQNASATGGLRGGNVQAALSQFSPNLLNSLINQQYQRLGGLTQLGQNSAAGVGNAGMQSAGNIANLLQQQGAATAGGQLARGGAVRQAFGDALSIGSAIAGAGGFGSLFGGGAGAISGPGLTAPGVAGGGGLYSLTSRSPF